MASAGLRETLGVFLKIKAGKMEGEVRLSNNGGGGRGS